GFFSAVVTYWVASTDFRNWALVTSVSSIQNPPTRTAWAGLSAASASGELVPIVNSPPGIQTIPGCFSAGSGVPPLGAGVSDAVGGDFSGRSFRITVAPYAPPKAISTR